MITRGAIGSLLVLLGGLVIATLPHSAPALELHALARARGLEVGRMAGLVVVLVGLGLLAHAWLQLCRTVAAGERDSDEPGEGVRLLK